MVLGLAGLVYVALFPDRPHREVAVIVMLAALIDATVMWRFVDHERLARSKHLPVVLLGWNMSHTVAISTIAILDGGLQSPFVTMIFVSVVYAALTLPPWLMRVVAAWDGAALVVIGVWGGQPEQLLLYVPCAFILGSLAAVIAGELHRRVVATEAAQLETIEKLARAVEYRDASTGGHIERMATYARMVAARLGLPEDRCDLIRQAGPLHDVGKIGVPDRVLLKPGKLTLEERVVMERHAQAGHDLLQGSRSAVVQLGAEIALAHHERWDGQGYPNRISGEDIPLPARIVAVADVFDAVTTDRVYRPAMPFDTAVDLIRSGRGTQFDPAVVDAFLAALGEISEAGAGGDPAPTLPQGAELSAHEDGPVGAQDEPGGEARPDRSALA